MIERNRLHRTASAARAFLEPVWPLWHAARGTAPAVPSQWTCGRSSLFLQRVLSEDLGVASVWVCGTPRYAEDAEELGPYGFLRDGRWRSHAWVVAEDWIVDITADQFGAAPVIVSPFSDERYGRGPEDTATDESKQRRHQTVAGLWPLWLTSQERATLYAADR